MLTKQSSYHKLPKNPGVYLFLGNADEVLYIGKAKNLKDRVSSYFVRSSQLSPKTKILVSKIRKIKTITVPSEIEALLLEANCIKKYRPKYNSRLTDGKAYPFIKITIRDAFPKVLIARKQDDQKSLYFGPYPNSDAVRLVLRTIRRIFPYQSVVNHPKRACLYYHLALCPCPEFFVDKEYRQNINHIINFLKGEVRKVIKDLEKERNMLSKKERFEKAQAIQKKINAILYVTSPVYQKFDYKINPNLEEDIRSKELFSLKEHLNKYNLSIKKLERIECFDISNISGRSATGSMVVFANGQKDTSEYRRFKIITVDKVPNDFTMMEEVLKRRIRHKEWPYPNLIIVDGGKGQVSAALKAIYSSSEPAQLASREANIENSSRLARTITRVPVIGLAKREETIIILSSKFEIRNSKQIQMTKIQNLKRFGHSDFDIRNFTEVSLPRSSPALHLLMRIRDEAHRFAINYHKKLRSKTLMS